MAPWVQSLLVAFWVQSVLVALWLQSLPVLGLTLQPTEPTGGLSQPAGPDGVWSPVFAPALRVGADGVACEPRILIQNVGGTPAVGLLIFRDDATACPPHCAGPIAVGCTGAIVPGRSWEVSPDQIPASATSAEVLSLSLRDVLPDPARGAVPVADHLCSALKASIGDCSLQYAFRTAYDTGGEFAGISLGLAYGPPVSVEVQRDCASQPRGVGPPGSIVAAARGVYRGVRGEKMGPLTRPFRTWSFHAPFLRSSEDETSRIFVQNAGAECAVVELWLQVAGECRVSRVCQSLTLTSGAAGWIDPADCLPGAWEGAGWIHATGPVAVAVDVLGRGTAMHSYAGLPQQVRFGPAGPPLFDPGGAQLVAPVTLSHADSIRVHVQNIGGAPADLRLEALDRAGRVRSTWPIGSICAASSRHIAVPAVTSRDRVLRVVGTSRGIRPSLVGVLEMESSAGGATIPMRPLHELDSEWPQDSSVLVAAPHLQSVDTQTSSLHVANTVSADGYTDATTFVYDANGLLASFCTRLRSGSWARIETQALSPIADAIRGTAVISATYWTHRLRDAQGRPAERVAALALWSLSVSGNPSGAIDSLGAAGLYEMERASGFNESGRACPLPPPPVSSALVRLYLPAAPQLRSQP